MTTTEPATAWQLVERAQAGDRDAFGQLYRNYHDVVFRYVLYRVRDRQLAEDLAADTFVRALKRIDSVSYQGRDIGAWLMTIARNLVLDHVKSSRARLTTLIASDEPIWETAHHTPGPDTIIPEQRAAEDAAVRLDAMISQLTGTQWMAIRARFYGGLSIAEAADLMGCTVGAMKAAQHRAVKALAVRARPARTAADFTAPGETR